MSDAAANIIAQVEEHLRQAKASFSECDSLLEKIRSDDATDARIAEIEAKIAEAKGAIGIAGGASTSTGAPAAASAGGADAEALASDLDLKLSMAEMFASDPDTAAPYIAEAQGVLAQLKAASPGHAKVAEAETKLAGMGATSAPAAASAAAPASAADAEALASDLDLKLSMAEMFASDPDTAAPYIAEAQGVLAQLKAASPGHAKVAEAETKLAGMGASPAAVAAPASAADVEALASDLDLKLSMAEMFAGDPDTAAPYIAEAQGVLAQLKAASPGHAKVAEAETKLTAMGASPAAAAAPASAADVEALASDLDMKLSMAEMFAGDPDTAAPYIAEAQGVLAQLKAASPAHAKVAEAETKLAAMGATAPASASAPDASSDASSSAEAPPEEDEATIDYDAERPPKDDIEAAIRNAIVAAGAAQPPEAHLETAKNLIEALRAADASNSRIAEAEGELAAARLSIGKVQLDATREAIAMHRGWIESSLKALDGPKVEKYAAALVAILEPQRAFLESLEPGKALLAEGVALAAESRGKIEVLNLTAGAKKAVANADQPLVWTRNALTQKNAVNADKYWKDTVAKSATLLDPRIAEVAEVATFLKQYREVEARIAAELPELLAAEEVKKSASNIEGNITWLTSALNQKNAVNATKYSTELRKLTLPIRERFGAFAAAAALLGKADPVLARCDAELPALAALEAITKAEKDMAPPFGWVENAIKSKNAANAKKYLLDVQKAVAPLAEKYAADEKAQAVLAKVAALGARVQAECPA